MHAPSAPPAARAPLAAPAAGGAAAAPAPQRDDGPPPPGEPPPPPPPPSGGGGSGGGGAEASGARCLLSALPPTLLEIIAARVEPEWKHALRLSCRHARAAVNATTRTLALSRHPALARPREQPLPPAVAAAVRSVFPNVTTLVLRDQVSDFLGEPGDPPPGASRTSSCCLSALGSLSLSDCASGSGASSSGGAGSPEPRGARGRPPPQACFQHAGIAAALHAAAAGVGSFGGSSSGGSSGLLPRSGSRGSLFSSDESSSGSEGSSGSASFAPGHCCGAAGPLRGLRGSFLSVNSAGSRGSSSEGGGCACGAAAGKAPEKAADAPGAPAAAPPCACPGGGMGCGCDVVRSFCLGPPLLPQSNSWSALQRIVMHFEALTGG
jgi:hypothetical protein